MSISSDFIKIADRISKKVDLPLIKEIITPQSNEGLKKSNFSVIILEDNTIGLVYINLNPIIKNRFYLKNH
jgi:hypothetical protein